jgi:group I intron endonuclease
LQGVYIINNIENGKMYIGSSINIDKRIKEHMNKLKNNTHHNYKLQIDYNNADNSIFIYEILEEVVNFNMLKEREDYFIKLYDSINKGYNFNKSNSEQISNYEELRLLMDDYFKKSKKFRVPINIPYINKKGTTRQINLKIKIFTVLMELHNILDNYYLDRINKIIISETLKVKLIIDIFTIDGISINIEYTLKDTGSRVRTSFLINDIYKIMKEKNIELQKAILKCIINKKNFNLM